MPNVDSLVQVAGGGRTVRPSRRQVGGTPRWLLRRAAPALAVLAAAFLLAGPALGAEPAVPAAELARARDLGADAASVRAVSTDDDVQDAFDGGLLPPARRVVVPSVELGLSYQRPIPVGVTCSCTVDRTGLISQFDITVIRVVQDAYPMVQQLNRFNRPPRPGARYVAAYVGQQYIAGPENQAYTTTEADWKAAATDERLSDVAQLLHTEVEYRPRADVYPGNYVNGWLIFELPVNRPAYLVWKYNFVGERGVWFALQ